MAHSILVIAESGSGKSHAIQFLDPKETFIINVANKPLPFKGWRNKYKKLDSKTGKGNLSGTSTSTGILAAMDYVDKKRPDIKNVIIDDWQYMAAFEYFNRADETGYKKFTDIGQALASVAKKPASMRDDLFVFYLTHSEETSDERGTRKQKAKTIGKMVDEKLTIEGLFAIVLYAKVKKNADGEMEYVFQTKTSGYNTCKSPYGMFEETDVDNNLQLVKDAIIEYEQ
jgi:hypothetical protein